jgi:hypothetical protein
MQLYLTIRLRSDATFGRGEGVAGLVDVEIDHDEVGCPIIGGRVLKGLLREECANLRFVLGASWSPWQPAANQLFGEQGATQEDDADLMRAAIMRISPATLPPDLCDALHRDVRRGILRRHEILTALTSIRRQTAVDARTGSPAPGSLRAMRVLLRETCLIATLDFDRPPDERALPLLAACALATRRGGTGRNRGRGRLALLLHEQLPADYDDPTATRAWFDRFAAEVRA